MDFQTLRYHPRIGLTYLPNIRRRVPDERGAYLLRTNAAGFRSDREFRPDRNDDAFRVLLFGDSQTAGNFISNGERYSDLLEAAIPGVEVYNYGLTATGTDQHFLIFEECANVHYDLVIIAIYIENILRVANRVLGFKNAKGEDVFLEKPYFETRGNELILQNVPVQKQPWTAQALPAQLTPYVYRFGDANLLRKSSRYSQNLVALANRLPLGLHVRNALKTLYALATSRLKANPIAHYDDPGNPSWQLLRRILQEWIRRSTAPVLIMPLPTDLCLRVPHHAKAYRKRFAEFCAAEHCLFFDPLPELLTGDGKERGTLFCNRNGHLTREGHQRLTQLLAPVVAQQIPAKRPAAVAV